MVRIKSPLRLLFLQIKNVPEKESRSRQSRKRSKNKSWRCLLPEDIISSLEPTDSVGRIRRGRRNDIEEESRDRKEKVEIQDPNTMHGNKALLEMKFS